MIVTITTVTNAPSFYEFARENAERLGLNWFSSVIGHPSITYRLQEDPNIRITTELKRDEDGRVVDVLKVRLSEPPAEIPTWLQAMVQQWEEALKVWNGEKKLTVIYQYGNKEYRLDD